MAIRNPDRGCAVVIDVICVGDAFQDVILSGFTALPGLGEEAFADCLDRDIGGGAPITASGLARLGFRSELLSCVGAHDSGWLRERLGQCGVEDSLLQLHETLGTALTVSVSTPEDRIYYTYAGANGALSMDVDSLPPARALHLALRPPPDCASLVRRLKERKVFVTLDVGWHPDWLCDPASISCMREVDVFFLNNREASAITRESEAPRILDEFRGMGLSRVAMKRGAEGASLLWDGKVFYSPAEHVACKDTTGAGDCFNAGFLAGWLHGWSPEECLRAGVFCGTESTREAGGIRGFPTLEQWRTNRR